MDQEKPWPATWEYLKLIFNFYIHILQATVWSFYPSSYFVPVPDCIIYIGQGCIKANFFLKSPGGCLRLVKNVFYWSKLVIIFSKQINQNVTHKFNYYNQECNVKQHNHQFQLKSNELNHFHEIFPNVYHFLPDFFKIYLIFQFFPILAGFFLEKGCTFNQLKPVA